MVDRIGSWGTDLELFLAAKLLKTDIFVYRNSISAWLKISGQGFVNRHDDHPLTDKRLYFKLFMDHYQSVNKVTSEKVIRKRKKKPCNNSLDYRAVVLNRGCTHPLGVRATILGGAGKEHKYCL